MYCLLKLSLPHLLMYRILILSIGLAVLLIAQFLIISSQAQLAILGTILVLTGIPHGALDLYLERQNRWIKSEDFSVKKFYFNYLLSIAGYTLLWYFLPLLSFIIFIVISSFHFGEIDTYIFSISRYKKLFSFLYGFIFLTLIITSHIEESIYIISSFIQSPWNDTQMIHFGKWVYELTSIGLFVLILIYFIFLKNDRTKLIYFALQSSILLGIVYFLPFYIGFAFYFGLWHSLLSFDLIFSHLRVKRDFFGIKEVFFKLLPFNILALGGIILFVWLHNSVQMKSIIGHTFIGLSLITLPHVQVFSRSLNKK